MDREQYKQDLEKEARFYFVASHNAIDYEHHMNYVMKCIGLTDLWIAEETIDQVGTGGY